MMTPIRGVFAKLLCDMRCKFHTTACASSSALFFLMPARRAILQHGSLCLAGLGGGNMLAATADAKPLLRAGLMTDLHYADKEPTKKRFYREALAKLDEAVDVMNREKPARLLELGDFIDQADAVDLEIEWLKTMEARFARLSMPRHYVLRNHCVDTVTKQEFTAHTKAAGSFERFESGGITFLSLDSCFRSDGTPYSRKNFDWKDANLPASELAWLEEELGKAAGPVIVLAH